MRIFAVKAVASIAMQAVHIRLYRGLPNGSRQAVNLNLPRADCQEHFANLDKSVQDFFSSPREVVCDKILKPGLAVVETEGFLCNDGALMVSFSLDSPFS